MVLGQAHAIGIKATENIENTDILDRKSMRKNTYGTMASLGKKPIHRDVFNLTVKRIVGGNGNHIVMAYALEVLQKAGKKSGCCVRVASVSPRAAKRS